MPKNQKHHWSNDQLERLWSSVAVVVPPAAVAEEWDDVASVYNAGLPKKLTKTKKVLFKKFEQLHVGPSTGGGGKRSDRQEKTRKIFDLMVKLDNGGSLTRSDGVFLSGVNSSNFERNLFERPEFEETSNVEFENNAAEEETPAAVEDVTTNVEFENKAAEEETPAAVEDVVMCKKRLNFMKFEEDILLRIQKDLRTRARNWSGTHLEQYHDAVADFCRKELDKADIGTMRRARLEERIHFKRSHGSLARKAAKIFQRALPEHAEALKLITEAKEADAKPEKTRVFRGDEIISSLRKKQEAALDVFLNEFKKKQPTTPPRIMRARKVLRLAKEMDVHSPVVTKAKNAIESYLVKLMDEGEGEGE
eukprot:g5221.t1